MKLTGGMYVLHLKYIAAKTYQMSRSLHDSSDPLALFDIKDPRYA